MNELDDKEKINPFNIGSIAIKEGFFNQEEILNRIQIFLETKTEHHLLIHGQRRIGKTSLLRHIQFNTTKPVHSVYYDLQDNAGTPLRNLLNRIVKQIAADLKIELSLPDDKIEEYQFCSIIKQISAEFKEQELLLLLFDEFDVLGEVINIKNDLHLAANRFIPFITHWIEEIAVNYLPVKIIFAIGRNYRDLDNERYGQLQKFSRQIELEYFKKEDVTKMIHSLSDGVLPFDEEAIEMIYTITSGHPFFTQALAFESFSDSKQKHQYRVTKDNVSTAFEPAINAVGGGIKWFWGQFSPLQKIVLYLIAHIEEKSRPVNKKSIEMKAENSHLPPGLENYVETINQLTRSKILKSSKKNLCDGFLVPFFRKWIMHEIKQDDLYSLIVNTDEDVKHNLYNGKFLYNKGNLTRALDFFNRVLKKDPRHLVSSYYAGKILFQLYQQTNDINYLKEAVNRIEWIYQENSTKEVQEVWEEIIIEVVINQIFDKNTKVGKIALLKDTGTDFQDKFYRIVKQNKTFLFAFFKCLTNYDIRRLASRDYDIPDKISEAGKDILIKYLYSKFKPEKKQRDKNDLEIIRELERKLNKKLYKFDGLFFNNCGYVLNQKNQVKGIGFFECWIQDLNLIIDELKNLPGLIQLKFYTNLISDISPLIELPNLQKLDLYNNQIKDVSPLTALARLHTMRFHTNRIEDIYPLKDLTKLTILELHCNQINDIRPLEKLTNLERLHLHTNRIRNISPLKKLTHLKKLSLHTNEIDDIAPLKDLSSLKFLTLHKNRIDDITALKNLNKLTTLNLTCNRINDITPLKDLNKLTTLNLAHNQISDITPIQNLINLKSLTLYNNQITDFTPVKELKKIKESDLDNNPAKIPPLEIVKQGIMAVQDYFKRHKL